ncbi:hypothetical protein D3C77_521850 [compost metagenome]
MKANGAMMPMPFRRSGRWISGAVARSDIRLIGPVRNEITTATEITAASTPQPRKKNRKMKLTARFSHIAWRGTPYSGCRLPKIFGRVLFFSIA